MKDRIPQPAKNLYHFVVAAAAALFFRFPGNKLKIIGVTGTDGKTTTVNLTHHILNEVGIQAGMISTLSAKIAGKTYETGFHVTTPSAFSIQKYLRKMVDSGVEYAVIEVTSHGLDQGRVAFVPFFIGLITNVTPEHLDYHRSFKNYVLTKAKILSKVKYRVLNAEDQSFESLKMMGTGQLVSFGGQGTDYFGEEIDSYDSLTTYAIHYRTKQKQLKTLAVSSKLIGEFNLLNILAAFAIGKLVGIEDKKLVNAISSFEGVPGRMQEVNLGQDFRIFIDFAHTPKSIELALNTLRKTTQNKLICVFGAAGERDPSKRVLMGQVAAKSADLIILTSEDPRSESPVKIVEQISKGVEREGGRVNIKYWKIIDRAEAIRKAVGNLAGSGDTVIILGKGHEQTMSIGGKEYSWSDLDQTKKALENRLSQQ